MNFIRTLAYVLGCISFMVVIGGATYEHLAVVPVWASAVPASLTMFQGEYAIDAARFWIPIHPVTLALMVLALILNWQGQRRGHLLTVLAAYVLILAATFFYFVPELMAITGSTYSPSIDADLTGRAQTWETLSIVRLVVLFVLAMVLLFGLPKPPVDRLRQRYRF